MISKMRLKTGHIKPQSFQVNFVWDQECPKFNFQTKREYFSPRWEYMVSVLILPRYSPDTGCQLSRHMQLRTMILMSIFTLQMGIWHAQWVNMLQGISISLILITDSFWWKLSPKQNLLNWNSKWALFSLKGLVFLTVGSISWNMMLGSPLTRTPLWLEPGATNNCPWTR